MSVKTTIHTYIHTSAQCTEGNKREYSKTKTNLNKMSALCVGGEERGESGGELPMCRVSDGREGGDLFSLECFEARGDREACGGTEPECKLPSRRVEDGREDASFESLGSITLL